MLVHWQSHQEYLYFLHETKVHLDSSGRTRLQLEFSQDREKLRLYTPVPRGTEETIIALPARG